MINFIKSILRPLYKHFRFIYTPLIIKLKGKKAERLKDFSLVNKNVDLVNKYEGDTCYLIGCGPSIKRQDLTKLKNKNVIALSTFFHHEDYKKLNIIANVFTGYTFHNNIHEESDFVNQYRDILKYCKGLIFFHENDFNFMKRNLLLNEMGNIRFYKTRGDINKNNILDIKPALDKEIYAGQNIAVFAIQMAISMGFKKIYLLGLDHDWIFKLQKKEYTKFESSNSEDYYKFAQGKTDFDIKGHDTFSFWISVYNTLWLNYFQIKKLANAEGISIVNITDGGVLDVFERENYNDLL